MNKKFGEFTALAEGRSNIYKFFSIVYSKPSKDFVDKIILSVFSDSELFKSIGNTDLDGFEVEYTRLFVASGKHYVPPYESVHKDKRTLDCEGMLHSQGLIWGDSTVRVAGKVQRSRNECL